MTRRTRARTDYEVRWDDEDWRDGTRWDRIEIMGGLASSGSTTGTRLLGRLSGSGSGSTLVEVASQPSIQPS